MRTIERVREAIDATTADGRRFADAHGKVLDWALRRNCAHGDHLLSPPDPDELIDALAEAYEIEIE